MQRRYCRGDWKERIFRLPRGTGAPCENRFQEVATRDQQLVNLKTPSCDQRYKRNTRVVHRGCPGGTGLFGQSADALRLCQWSAHFATVDCESKARGKRVVSSNRVGDWPSRLRWLPTRLITALLRKVSVAEFAHPTQTVKTPGEGHPAELAGTASRSSPSVSICSPDCRSCRDQRCSGSG